MLLVLLENELMKFVVNNSIAKAFWTCKPIIQCSLQMQMQNLKTFFLQVYFVNVAQTILIFFFFLHKFLGNQKRPAKQGLVSCPRNLFALIVQQTWMKILWRSVVKHLPKARWMWWKASEQTRGDTWRSRMWDRKLKGSFVDCSQSSIFP